MAKLEEQPRRAVTMGEAAVLGEVYRHDAGVCFDALPQAPEQKKISPTTRAMQGMHLSMAAAGLVVPGAMDDATAALWHAFNAQPLTHHCMFEASLAVSAFVVFIFFFESMVWYVPNARRIDGQAPERPLANFTPAEAHKTIVPAVAYLASIAAFHQLELGPLLFGVKPAFEDPTFARVTCEVSQGVFLYDLLFYPFHLSFHRARLASWRSQHMRHHAFAREEAVAHNAVETVQNSYLDSGIQVFINICVQNFSTFGHKHPLSRALHNLMVVYLLCESHSGYDLPFMSHRVFPGVFGGPVRHEAHHQHGGIYYHQFFCYLDDFFGFVDKRGTALRAANRHDNLQVQKPSIRRDPE
jgi:sterol desaturase/sphingolipid hydroxylase (fatty acid hydroxylase superfamily)